MKKLLKKLGRKSKAIILGLLIVGLSVGGYYTWIHFNKTPESKNVDVVVNKENMVYRRIYLISNKDLVVPLSVSFEKKADLADELVYVTTLLREGSPVIKGNLRAVLHKDVKINKLQIKDKVLTIDFSEEFANYEAKHEVRILEALAWTYSQYNEIKSVKISVKDQVLTHMPVGKTPIPQNLNKEFGINNHVFHREINSVSVITLYETTINDDVVYIPVTKGVKFETNFINTVSKNITGQGSILSGLSPVRELENLNLVNATLTEDRILELEVGIEALVDESSVSKEIYDLLVIHFTEQILNVVSVTVKVDGEVMQVSGYDEEVIPVSSIIYNETKI